MDCFEFKEKCRQTFTSKRVERNGRFLKKQDRTYRFHYSTGKQYDDPYSNIKIKRDELESMTYKLRKYVKKLNE